VSFDTQAGHARHRPQALRALAHPLRLDILDRLTLQGPMTATRLGEALGESAANCSWHLRKLAEHGLVAPADEGQGRSRPWRITASGAGAAPGTAAASDRVQQLLAQVLIDREVARFAANRAQGADGTWDELHMANQAVLWLTAPEAEQLTADLLSVLSRREQPTGAEGQRPPDSRPVRVLTLTSVDPVS
jgi:DNA-binding transcriptional ArsR family regulator